MTAKTRTVGLLAGALLVVLVAALALLLRVGPAGVPADDERALLASDQVLSVFRGENGSSQGVIAGLRLVDLGPAVSLGTPQVIGRIVRQRDGAPLAGVEVSALIETHAEDESSAYREDYLRRWEKSSGALLGRTLTRADGTFVLSLPKLSEEPDYLMARHRMHAPSPLDDGDSGGWNRTGRQFGPILSQRVKLTDTGESWDDVQITMDVGWDLHGVIMRTDGSPLRSVRVKAILDGKWRKSSWSAEDGTYRLTDLPPTSLPVEVIISEPQHKTQITEVHPPSSGEWETTLTVALEKLGAN